MQEKQVIDDTKRTEVDIPEICYALLPEISMSRKDVQMKISPILIKRFETQYHQTDYNWPCTVADAIKYVNEANEGLGISKAERETMLLCSMFNRWTNYGEILKKHQKLEAEGKLD